jgi:TolB-like protein
MHGPSLPSDGFLGRLKSHKVIEWTLAYAALAYKLLHGVEMVGEALSWPHWIARVLTLLLILGVPVIALLAWYHGQRQLKRVSGAELIMITLLGVIAGSVLWGFSGSGEEHKAAQAPAIAKPAAAPAAAEQPAPRTAVAVLPFANLTGDASKEYLGDGMAEELINTLTNVPGLKVPARTSSFAYKGRNVNIRDIAKDLQVGTLLEGSVRAAGKRLRITAQLINAQDGLHIWSETYDEEFTDIFKLQDKLANAIVQVLQIKLSGTGDTIERTVGTKDVEAYNLTLQGYALWENPTSDGLTRAVNLFEQALQRDPNYAHAWSGVAWAKFVRSFTDPKYAEDSKDAERAARRALSIDPNDGPAHTVLGSIDFDRNLVEGEQHWRAALAGAPNDPSSHSLYVFQLFFVGHLRDALANARKAYAMGPSSVFAINRLARALGITGANADAIQFASRAIALGWAPEEMTPVRMSIALRNRDIAAAEDELMKTIGIAFGDAGAGKQSLRTLFAALRDTSKRPQALAIARDFYPTPRFKKIGARYFNNSNCDVAAYLYVLLGAVDQAYDVASRCQVELGLQPADIWGPEMRPFRLDPRFDAFMRRTGRHIFEYWEMYGPPDDCEIKNNKLTCH